MTFCLQAAANKSGYHFIVANLTGTPVVTYSSTATPVVIGQSGQRGFYSDQSGVIRYTTDGTAPHERESGTLRTATCGPALCRS